MRVITVGGGTGDFRSAADENKRTPFVQGVEELHRRNGDSTRGSGSKAMNGQTWA